MAFWREVTTWTCTSIPLSLRWSLAGRHAAADARILAVLPRETAMADPAGRVYRLTGVTDS